MPRLQAHSVHHTASLRIFTTPVKQGLLCQTGWLAAGCLTPSCLKISGIVQRDCVWTHDPRLQLLSQLLLWVCRGGKKIILRNGDFFFKGIIPLIILFPPPWTRPGGSQPRRQRCDPCLGSLPSAWKGRWNRHHRAEGTMWPLRGEGGRQDRDPLSKF